MRSGAGCGDKDRAAPLNRVAVPLIGLKYGGSNNRGRPLAVADTANPVGRCTQDPHYRSKANYYCGALGRQAAGSNGLDKQLQF